MQQRCTECGKEKDVEAFAWANKVKGRRQKMCRACFSAYMKARTLAKGEELRAKQRDSYQKHRDSRIAKVREYYRENADAINAKRRDEYKVNGAEIRDRNRESYHRHGEERRKYHRAYYRENRDVLTAKTRVYAKTERGRQARDRSRKRQLEKHKHKIQARWMVQNAVRDGKLHKPDACSRCGQSGKVEGHHHKGYGREHWLDVVWLCPTCHDLADQTPS